MRVIQHIQFLWAKLNRSGERAKSGRAALLSFGVRIGGAVFTYILHIAMARLLGQEPFGIYVAIWIWVLIFGALAPFGLHTAVVRFVSEGIEKKNDAQIRGAVWGIPLLVLAISALFTVAGLLIISVVKEWVTSYYLMPIILGFLCLPAFAVTETLDGVARGFRWTLLALIPVYMLRPLLILTGIVGAYLLGFKMDAVLGFYVTLIAVWIIPICMSFVLYRRLKHLKSGSKSEITPKSWLKISASFLLVEAFFMLLTNTDVAVLAMFEKPSQVGVYFVAVKIMALVSMIYFAVRVVMEPRFSEASINKDRDTLEHAILDGSKWVFVPSLIAILFLILTGPVILLLFGSSFVAGYWPMAILSVGMLCRSSIGPAINLLMMIGHEREGSKVYLWVFLCNLAFNFTLIPLFGLHGAAIATSVAMVLEAVLLRRLVLKYTNIDPFVFPVLYRRCRQYLVGA